MDYKGFSAWRVDFKYNEELTQTFMSSNQIGGFFNRLEASRKYLFASVGVLGTSGDSMISGALILRGQDVKAVQPRQKWEHNVPEVMFAMIYILSAVLCFAVGVMLTYHLK